jgi:DNA-binding NarL/FixJ family response regulator
MDGISVMLVYGSALSRIGLQSLVERCANLKMVDNVGGFERAVARAQELGPEVIVIDGGISDFDLAEYAHTVLRGYGLSCGILIVAEEPNDAVWRAIRAGARGFILERNTPTHLISAIHMVAMGYSLMATQSSESESCAKANRRVRQPEVPSGALAMLTDREVDILALVARGWSNSDISAALDLAESTVKSHIGSVFVKLGLRNRVHAVIYAYEVGLVRAAVDDEPLFGPGDEELLDPVPAPHAIG